jgi:hypothetical protein
MSDDLSVQQTTAIEQPVPRQTTADDLLDMYAQEEAEQSKEIDTEAEKQARIAEEVPKKMAARQLAKNLDQDGQNYDEGEDDGSLQESSEESSEEDSEESQQKDQEVAVKAIKAKLGEEEVDLPEEAEITEKIGNKEVTFKVKDAIKAYTRQEEFNRNMDRRVSEISSRERNLQSKFDEVKIKAGKIAQLAQQGEWIPVVKALAKMAVGDSGQDPVEYEKACLESLGEVYKVFTGMTKEQRDVYFAKRRAEAAEDKARQLETRTQRSEATRALEQEIETLRSQHGIPQQKFWQLYETLVKNQVGEGKRFSAPEEVEPEHVIEFHSDVQHIGKIHEAAEAVSPALSEDADFCMEVFRLTKDHPEFTSEDLQQIIRDALKQPNKSIENLNRKVAHAQSKGMAAQFKQASSTGQKDAIDEELEEFFFKPEKRARQIAALTRR